MKKWQTTNIHLNATPLSTYPRWWYLIILPYGVQYSIKGRLLLLLGSLLRLNVCTRIIGFIVKYNNGWMWVNANSRANTFAFRKSRDYAYWQCKYQILHQLSSDDIWRKYIALGFSSRHILPTCFNLLFHYPWSLLISQLNYKGPSETRVGFIIPCFKLPTIYWLFSLFK